MSVDSPLTPERRAEIEREMAQEIIYADWGDLYDFVHDLLSAEQYWREAVRDASFEDDHCSFCGVSQGDHKPDCAYIRAQEGDNL